MVRKDIFLGRGIVSGLIKRSKSTPALLRCNFSKLYSQNGAETTLRNENQTVVPSFHVQNIAEHQDTMSLQDVDLGSLHDEPVDYENRDENTQIPHIERTLTEESAGNQIYKYLMRFVASILKEKKIIS